MKKICWMLFFLCICGLCACQTSNEEGLEAQFRTNDFLADYDVPQDYAAADGTLCRVGDVYYASLGNLAVYHDSVSGLTGALCDRADCSHSDTNCNAYLAPGNVSGIQIYDGKLHWLQAGGLSRTLYRMDLDGNHRESVQTVDDISGLAPRFAIHRGYVYTSVMKSEMEKGQSYYVLEIKQYKLGDTEQEAQVIYSQRYDGELNYNIRFYRDHFYVAVDNDETLESKAYHRELFSYDLSAQKWELIWEDTLPWTTRAILVDGTGAEVLEIQYGTPYTVQRVRIDFESGTRTEMGTIVPIEEEFQSASMVNGYIVLYTFTRDEPRESHMCRILDWNTYEVVSDHEIQGDFVYCIGSDENGIVLTQNGGEDMSDTQFLSSYRILQVPFEAEQEVQMLFAYDMIQTVGQSGWESRFPTS